MRSFRHVIAITSVLLVASSLTPIPVQAATGSVAGTVIDDDSGEPAVGVEISACEDVCRGSATTDAAGHYRLDGIPSSSWNVVANQAVCGASQYAPAHKYGVTVADGTTVPLDLHTTRRVGAITGRVLDAAGAPIPNVGIVVDNAETGGFGFGGATSAADGTYTVSCLAAAGIAGTGRYYVTAIPPTASGFGQQQDAGVAVQPGSTVTHDVVLRIAPGWVSGLVTCAGKPCGASVMVYCEGCGSSAVTWTSSDGRYRAANLQPGYRYDVHAQGAAGWANVIHYGVPVATGGTTVDLNLIRADAVHSGRLTGTIRDAAGAPAAGCLINAFGGTTGSAVGGWVDGDVHTARDGSYDTGSRLMPGSYEVFLDCPGWSEVRIDAGQTIRVEAGAPTPADYVLSEPGRPFQGSHDVVGAPAPARNAYFAEGLTQTNVFSSFHEYFAIQNPGPAQTLMVRYYLSSGTLLRTYRLPASSRSTINVNVEVGPNQPVSAWLNAPRPFVAERLMYFMYPGGISGGDATMGTPALSTTSYFAEGYTGSGFHESLLLFNPNARQPATALVSYFFADGTAPKTVAHMVAPASRATVDVANPAEAGPNRSVSVLVMSDVPILAERSIYFNRGGKTGGTAVVGATHPSQHLDLAEGYVGNGFSEFLAILNPNEVDATATITYLLENGEHITRTMAIPAESRQTRLVNADLPDGSASAIHIDADLPLVVERPMYVTAGGRTGGHDAMAVDEADLSTSASFADGYVGGCSGSSCFAGYFSILNASDQVATVTLTYYLSGGGTTQRTFTVPSRIRVTRAIDGDLPDGTTFSARLTSDQPLVVERPVYFAY